MGVPVHHGPGASRLRWRMLSILCLDICVSYLPYYGFVPILTQAMQAYGVNETNLNLLCIVYALVYVPGAFLTGPIVGAVGCKWAFVLAMALNLLGCCVRCGPGLTSSLFPWLAAQDHAVLVNASFDASHGGEVSGSLADNVSVMSFSWLAVGQVLCALGQPLLVNSTSEMGAEWFPPHERPTAAMVSNLMNYIGSSFSFMLPTMIVDERPQSLEGVESQVMQLLQLQLWVALVAFSVTLCFYQSIPRAARLQAAGRVPVSFATEVIGVFSRRDFWIVNLQFAIFAAIGNAFDAVEGSLLEHHGYSAALTSMTGLSCCVGAILSTFIETRCINDPSLYRQALMVANLMLVTSSSIAYLCLTRRLHEYTFVFAVFVMGLATPGWGCSFELGSEVGFPAREATVSSLMEAWSNMLGVVGILWTQNLIDSGFGAGVLLMMACAAAVGGCLLFGLTGRLHRSEAEAAIAEAGDEAFGADYGVDTSKLARLSSYTCLSGVFPKQFRLPDLLVRSVLAVMCLSFVFVTLLMPTDLLPSDLAAAQVEQSHELMTDFSVHPEDLQVRPTDNTSLSSAVAERHSAAAVTVPSTFLANGIPEPQNYILSCSRKAGDLGRIKKELQRANMTYVIAPCVKGTRENVERAVREKLLPASALDALEGSTREGRPRLHELGFAISHLEVMRNISKAVGSGNIMDVKQLFHKDYQQRRNQVLGSLPRNVCFVNLNAVRPSGHRVALSHEKNKKHKRHLPNVVRMRKGLSPFTNTGLGNYVVTTRGARMIMHIGRMYDTFGKFESFNAHLLSQLYLIPGFEGLAVSSPNDVEATAASAASVVEQDRPSKS
eukprot:TRINITY_DN70131_c0_g1_i1.p1 TRINITY_DN70131_c0_g1~~TRINITY_DN70131_c0_g1_i1.p1  ORF type:complete len:833 (+),score=154.75 TRINITY_DN70131_c0_g1_i1:151-2649(+)